MKISFAELPVAAALLGVASSAWSAEPAPLPPEYLQDERAGFSFAYHPSARERVRPLLDAADGIRAELATQLGRDELGDVRVRIAVGVVDLERVVGPLAAVGGEVVLDRTNVTLSFALAEDALDGGALRAFRGGLAELALERATDGNIPRWFRTGFTRAFAEPSSFARKRVLAWGILTGQAASIADLEERLAIDARPGSLAEAEAISLVGSLSDERLAFHRLVADCPKDGGFSAALAAAYHLDGRGLADRWRVETGRYRIMAWVGIAAVFLAALFSIGARLRRAWHAIRRRSVAPPPDPSPLGTPVSEVRFVRIRRSNDDGLSSPRRREATEHDLPKIAHDGRWHTLH